MSKHGAYVGRINPLHLGHEAVGEEMLKQFGVENSMLIMGSSNTPFSLRHFFSYEERRGFVKKVFPELKIVGLPDYPTDKEWLVAMDDLLIARGFDPLEVVFFGGCEEDILFFYDAGRKCHILNRFDGTTPKISATEVRDCLIYGRSLEGMINPLIAGDVRDLFAQKWERFKKI